MIQRAQIEMSGLSVTVYRVLMMRRKILTSIAIGIALTGEIVPLNETELYAMSLNLVGTKKDTMLSLILQQQLPRPIAVFLGKDKVDQNLINELISDQTKVVSNLLEICDPLLKKLTESTEKSLLPALNNFNGEELRKALMDTSLNVIVSSYINMIVPS